MLTNIKDLIVVLLIATVVFKLVKPTALLFSNEGDFVRRRNVWYALTCLAFLSPSFWLYALIVAPILFVSGRRDSNPAALYLFLMHVIPILYAPIRLGSATLIDVSIQTLLCLLVIIPAIKRVRKLDASQRITGLHFIDFCFLAHGILTSFLYLHQLAPNGAPYPLTVIDCFRRILVFSIAGFAPYFVISRLSSRRDAVMDNAAAFLIPCVVMAAIAIFESLRGWLLYEVIGPTWGLAASFAEYLVRDSVLRAMASSGHPLALGYLLDVAFAIWLSLASDVRSRFVKAAISGLLLLGLFASYSRGPWATAVLIYFVFAIQKRNAISGLSKAVATGLIAAVIIALSPLGQKIAAVLPFLGGHVDTENIDYRQHLWDRAWELAQLNPLFGDQYALTKMQDLRQGQGIVDFVNGYAAELISSGFAGLGLFFIVVLVVLAKTISRSRGLGVADQRFGMIGASIVCAIAGTLFLWAFGGPDPAVLWALVALGLGYSYIGSSLRDEALRTSRSP